jgi:hypothetical protein
MPFDRPGTMTSSQVYSLNAYILYLNGIVKENEVMDTHTLPRIQMPNHSPRGRRTVSASILAAVAIVDRPLNWDVRSLVKYVEAMIGAAEHSTANALAATWGYARREECRIDVSASRP